MRQLVALYINNQKVDFREPFHINLTYTMEDVTNPPAVKNNYSKTVVVEGTENNNRIFGNLWNIHTVAGANAYDFDLTRKNGFKLYLNGEMMESGYVKLDKIVKKRNTVEYHITLYGGLGDFFYNLSMKEDGEKKKLSDLDFGDGENEFDTIVNKAAVSTAWRRLGYGFAYNSSIKYDKINFAPCYNGVPADWDTKKFMVDMKNNPFLEQPQPEGPSGADGVFLAEVLGEREYTEWDAGDLRSYMQRPVLRVRALIEAIQNPRNNGGYKVILDNDFFDFHNPYYEKAWITLPLLRDTDIDDTGSEGYFRGNPGTFSSTETIIPITVQNPTLKNNRGSIEVPFKLTADYDGIYPSLETSYKNIIFESRDKYYTGAYCVQLIARDSAGNPIYGSDSLIITSSLNGSSISSLGYTPLVPSSNVVKKGKFIKNTATGRYDFDRTFKVSINNMLLEDNMTFELRLEKIFQTNGSEIGNFGFDTLFRSRLPFEGPANLMNSFKIKADVILSPGSGTFKQLAPQKDFMTKKRILNSENSPLDYLLGYTKQFGLYFLKDPVKKEIRIMTRNAFYNDQDVIDLSKKIDYSKDINITPIAFDKKWYDFALDIEKSKYAEKYKKTHSIDFGVQRVNTNYEYDKKNKNLWDKNVYKNAVMLREKSNYKVNLYADYLTTEDPLPPMMIDGMQPYYFGVDKSVNASGEPFKGTKIDTLPAIYSTRYYDRAPLMCFYDKDKKPVDGSNVLCFFNGTVNAADINGKDVWLRLSDDTAEMMDLNDNKPCWIYSTTKTGKRLTIPVFSRYYTDDKSIIHSFNAGNPIETYTLDYAFNNNSSIYSKFWQDFIKDQYDKNTRVLECYVRLDRRVMQDYLRKLFYFEGAYWCLLEVNDFDICNFETTKCKFIKIQNIERYKSGQRL